VLLFADTLSTRSPMPRLWSITLMAADAAQLYPA
jgi:hypothetical protein